LPFSGSLISESKERGELLIRMNNELLADMHETEWSGPITIGAPSDYAPTLLQKLLPMLRIEFPRLEPKAIEFVFITAKRIKADQSANLHRRLKWAMEDLKH